MQETMSFHDKLINIIKINRLAQAGKHEEAAAIRQITPIYPWLAKAIKEVEGPEFVRNCGWDLSEVEAAFGHDWLYSYSGPYRLRRA
jgi:hypothetical protein